jgi:hypothetical protein
VVHAAVALSGKYGEPAAGLGAALEERAAPLQRRWLRRLPDAFGYLSLDVELPEGLPRRTETLLTFGDVYRQRAVCIHYLGQRRVAFTFVARGSEQYRSQPRVLSRQGIREISFEMGGLLPLNPRAQGRVWPGAPVEAWTRGLRVVVDGEEVLSGTFEFQPPARYLGIGRDWFGPERCGAPFSGRVVSTRRWLPAAVP